MIIEVQCAALIGQADLMEHVIQFRSQSAIELLTHSKIEPEAVAEGIVATRAKHEEWLDRNETIEIAGGSDIEAWRFCLQLPPAAKTAIPFAFALEIERPILEPKIIAPAQKRPGSYGRAMPPYRVN